MKVDPPRKKMYIMVMKDLFPTWKDKLIGAAVAVGLIVALALVAMLIKVTIPYSLVPVGFALWWIYYIAEVAINGGQTAGLALFEHAHNDFMNNFSRDSKEFRLNLANGDAEWASEFPGKIHCIVTHIVIPLAPLLIWIVL